jgi:hypothetical protein
MTYTFATLEVSQLAYDEVRAKLLAAGYEHAITSDSSEEELIDMHGIALVSISATKSNDDDRNSPA